MLFCKPSSGSDVRFEFPFGNSQVIRFRSLVIKKDLNVLHHWVNKPYAKFYQLTGSIEKLGSAYNGVLKNPDAHSIIGVLDEQLICLIDIYRIKADELGQHIEAKYHDCAMRLLMAPCEQAVPKLTRKLMEAFMRYYFSFSDARHLYAAPDIHNTKACRLFEKCGFSFLQNIMLSTSAASLYLMTRNQFHATHRNV